ncbi:DUF7427 family protein [Nocardia ignorata]|uniref:Uncharacterized protein n=1 Tax=Nocardia ignorata TaxID=145285 RepID=A0A4R6NZP8_NOCIG|nr:hypothetical protein [Nocardia ignorata]TDP29777.1 hypothetical protein DFR75_11241 [Nocardia ignorata]
MWRTRIRAGHLWLVLAGAVTALEVVAPEGELLSEGVDRGLEQHPLLVRTAIIITAAHLLNLLPEKIDPYARLPRVWK